MFFTDVQIPWKKVAKCSKCALLILRHIICIYYQKKKEGNSLKMQKNNTNKCDVPTATVAMLT